MRVRACSQSNSKRVTHPFKKDSLFYNGILRLSADTCSVPTCTLDSATKPVNSWKLSDIHSGAFPFIKKNNTMVCENEWTVPWYKVNHFVMSLRTKPITINSVPDRLNSVSNTHSGNLPSAKLRCWQVQLFRHWLAHIRVPFRPQHISIVGVKSNRADSTKTVTRQSWDSYETFMRQP